jgi:hypothetical protein
MTMNSLRSDGPSSEVQAPRPMSGAKVAGLVILASTVGILIYNIAMGNIQLPF